MSSNGDPVQSSDPEPLSADDQHSVSEDNNIQSIDSKDNDNTSQSAPDMVAENDSDENDDDDEDDLNCCHVCGMDAEYVNEGLRSCDKCKAVFYCSDECMKWDFEKGGHMNDCAALKGNAPKLIPRTNNDKPQVLCSVCGTSSNDILLDMKSCPLCKKVFYCSESCLKLDVKNGGHSNFCEGAKGGIAGTMCDVCGLESKFVPDGMITCDRCKEVTYCGLQCLKWDWQSGGHADRCIDIRGAGENPDLPEDMDKAETMATIMAARDKFRSEYGEQVPLPNVQRPGEEDDALSGDTELEFLQQLLREQKQLDDAETSCQQEQEETKSHHSANVDTFCKESKEDLPSDPERHQPTQKIDHLEASLEDEIAVLPVLEDKPTLQVINPNVSLFEEDEELEPPPLNDVPRFDFEVEDSRQMAGDLSADSPFAEPESMLNESSDFYEEELEEEIIEEELIEEEELPFEEEESTNTTDDMKAAIRAMKALKLPEIPKPKAQEKTVSDEMKEAVKATAKFDMLEIPEPKPQEKTVSDEMKDAVKAMAKFDFGSAFEEEEEEIIEEEIIEKEMLEQDNVPRTPAKERSFGPGSRVGGTFLPGMRFLAPSFGSLAEVEEVDEEDDTDGEDEEESPDVEQSQSDDVNNTVEAHSQASHDEDLDSVVDSSKSGEQHGDQDLGLPLEDEQNPLSLSKKGPSQGAEVDTTTETANAAFHIKGYYTQADLSSNRDEEGVQKPEIKLGDHRQTTIEGEDHGNDSLNRDETQSQDQKEDDVDTTTTDPKTESKPIKLLNEDDEADYLDSTQDSDHSTAFVPKTEAQSKESVFSPDAEHSDHPKLSKSVNEAKEDQADEDNVDASKRKNIEVKGLPKSSSRDEIHKELEADHREIKNRERFTTSFHSQLRSTQREDCKEEIDTQRHADTQNTGTNEELLESKNQPDEKRKADIQTKSLSVWVDFFHKEIEIEDEVIPDFESPAEFDGVAYLRWVMGEEDEMQVAPEEPDPGPSLSDLDGASTKSWGLGLLFPIRWATRRRVATQQTKPK